jgi:hypothetical protein
VSAHASTEDTVVVTGSRLRTGLLALAALAFVIGGLWMAGVLGTSPRIFRGGPRSVLAAVAWVSVVVFGLALAVLVGRLVRPRRALVLDARGFTDAASASAAGRVAWAEVTGVGTSGVGQQRLLVVDVSDEQALLERLPAGRRRLAAASRAVTGHPVNIPLAGLSVGETELLRLIRERCGLP